MGKKKRKKSSRALRDLPVSRCTVHDSSVVGAPFSSPPSLFLCVKEIIAAADAGKETNTRWHPPSSLSLFLSFFLVKRNRRRRRTEQGPRLIPRNSRNQNVNAEYSTSVAASRNVFSVVLSGKSGSRLVLYYKANIYLSQIAWTWSVV